MLSSIPSSKLSKKPAAGRSLGSSATSLPCPLIRTACEPPIRNPGTVFFAQPVNKRTAAIDKSFIPPNDFHAKRRDREIVSRSVLRLVISDDWHWRAGSEPHGRPPVRQRLCEDRHSLTSQHHQSVWENRGQRRSEKQSLERRLVKPRAGERRIWVWER